MHTFLAPSLIALSLVYGCVGQANAVRKPPASLVWATRSAEYAGAARGTFSSAARALPELMQRRDESAALEQPAPVRADLPPAVVVDVDETMLSNASYHWQRFEREQAFAEASWDAWIARTEATAVPGAVAFARAAHGLGIAVFYVTNRRCKARADNASACPQAQDTRANLVAAGFPEPDPEHLLLRDMRAAWSRDKASRRAFVAQRFRILALVGDDLGDFVQGASTASRAERARFVAQHAARWGRDWFVVPNPMYGSWEAAADD